MGTNYYWIEDKCLHCKRCTPKIHIGKSSWGWCFSLHVYTKEWEEGPRDLEEWQDWFDRRGSVIVDEYGDAVTKAEMIDIITVRGRGRYTKDDRLPRRHDIDGQHCIAHGKGTWDLIVGDFS